MSDEQLQDEVPVEPVVDRTASHLGLSRDAEYIDDAIHLHDPMVPVTLCGQSRKGRNSWPSGNPHPDAAAGCWTCMKVAEARHA
jgi:hypothetical protein